MSDLILEICNFLDVTSNNHHVSFINTLVVYTYYTFYTKHIIHYHKTSLKPHIKSHHTNKQTYFLHLQVTTLMSLCDQFLNLQVNTYGQQIGKHDSDISSV